MISKPVALGLVVIACVTAAAGGAYVAARQNHSRAGAIEPAPQTVEKAQQGVAETEAIVSPGAPVISNAPIERVTPAASEPVARTARVETATFASKDSKIKRDPQVAAARKPVAAAPPARSAQPAIAPEPAPAVEYLRRAHSRVSRCLT